MAARWLLLSVLLLLPLQACGGHARSDAGTDEDASVRSAMSLVRSGMVTRLEILYMPKRL
jgi:hypothetical protein